MTIVGRRLPVFGTGGQLPSYGRILPILFQLDQGHSHLITRHSALGSVGRRQIGGEKEKRGGLRPMLDGENQGPVSRVPSSPTLYSYRMVCYVRQPKLHPEMVQRYLLNIPWTSIIDTNGGQDPHQRTVKTLCTMIMGVKIRLDWQEFEDPHNSKSDFPLVLQSNPFTERHHLGSVITNVHYC
jgi:hypothetical protein